MENTVRGMQELRPQLACICVSLALIPGHWTTETCGSCLGCSRRLKEHSQATAGFSSIALLEAWRRVHALVGMRWNLRRRRNEQEVLVRSLLETPSPNHWAMVKHQGTSSKGPGQGWPSSRGSLDAIKKHLIFVFSLLTFQEVCEWSLPFFLGEGMTRWRKFLVSEFL